MRPGAAGRAVVWMALGGLLACAKTRLPPPQDVVDVSAVEVDVDRARSLLEAAAADGETWIRGTALRWLIRMETVKAGAPWGARALWDPDPWVRREAIMALSDRMGEAETQALFLSVMETSTADPYTRGAVALRLLKSHPAHAERVKALLADAEDASSWAQLPLLLAVAVAGDTTATTRLANEVLAEGEIPLDLGLIQDLGACGLPELGPGIVAGLEYMEEMVTVPIAGALVQLEHPDGERLLKSALDSGDPMIRMEVVDVLAALPPDVGSVGLQRVARGPAGPAQAYAAMVLHGRGQGRRDAVDRVLDGQDSEDADVELVAIALVSLAHGAKGSDVPRKRKSAERTLLAHLGHVHPRIRAAALEGLGILAVSQSAGLVAALMNDENGRVALEAAGTLLFMEHRLEALTADKEQGGK